MTPHLVVSVLWITYWLTNSYIWLADVAPFLNYYAITVLFLMYYALTRPNKVLQFIAHPMVWFWALTAVVAAVIYYSGDYDYYYAYSAMRGRIVFFSMVASVGLVLWDDEGRRALRLAATLSLFLSLTIYFGELFIFNPYNRSAARSAGFYADPNIAGNALIAQLLLSQSLRKQSTRSLVIVAITMLGVLTTLSRQAMLLGAFVSFAYLFLPRGPGTLQMGSRLVLAAGGIFAIVMAAVAAIFFLDLDTSETWRIRSILTFDLSDASSQGRVDRMIWSFHRFLDFFWTGRGPGASFEYGVNAHNAYITLGYNYGIFAVLIYVWVLSLGYFKVLRFGLQRALTSVVMTTQLFWVSIFDHTVHDHSVTAVVLAAIMTNAIIEPEHVSSQVTDSSAARESDTGYRAAPGQAWIHPAGGA